MSAKITVLNNDSSYDKIPYDSYPYTQTHPAHLRTLAKLFGMNNTAELDKARILELGCAAGNNILPIALNYPNAKIVGIDLSEVQIAQAKKQVNDFGLTNIEFHHKSIMDINKSFGEFDYIIVHGVMSWVPAAVQDKIFDICKINLSKKGIAYISYNTLPGWNMIRSVRDMMLYHTNGFSTELEKVQQSRLLLQFLLESTEKTDTPYAQMLKNEAILLAKQPDSYLFHEHMEENNNQFYFHEIISKAQSRNLQYLADANLPSMFLGNMPESVISKLQTINDIVRTEQYMDFVNNRRFRCTLLCHDSVKLNRNLQNEVINDFYVSMNIIPEKELNDVDLNNNEVLKFYIDKDNDIFVSSQSALMKSIFYILFDNKNHALSVAEIAAKAAILNDKFSADQFSTEFTNNAMKLVLAGFMNITTERHVYTRQLTDKPKVSKLAQYQAANQSAFWITNQKHEMVNINILEKYILRYLDGEHTMEELLLKLTQHVKNNELVLNQDGKPIVNDEVIRQSLMQAVNLTLSQLAPKSILVA